MEFDFDYNQALSHCLSFNFLLSFFFIKQRILLMKQRPSALSPERLHGDSSTPVI